MRLLIAGLALVAALLTGPASAQTPSSYPAGYADIVAGAKREAKLRVYATTDESSAQAMLADFQSLYPEIALDYSNLNSTELYNRVISESAAKQDSADMVWTGGMDTGMRLAADGYAAVYASPEVASLPKWAVWKDTAYGTTAEPLVFFYNKRLLPADAVPHSHAALLALAKAQPDLLRGKVTMLDPTRTAGLAQNVYDAGYMPAFWDLIRALAAIDLKLHTSSGAMIEKVSSGEYALAVNLFGAYAVLQVAKNPNVEMVLPTDYTLTSSRIAFVAKNAPHPNAARVFIDYLLSKRGQQLMADKAKLYPAREDVTGEITGLWVKTKLGDAAKPIPVSEELLDRVMNQPKRLAFIKRFQDAMRGK